MRRDWLREPEVAAGCYDLYLCDAPPAENLLRDILDQHPDRAVRGLACYWLAVRLDVMARIPDFPINSKWGGQRIEEKFCLEDVEEIRRRVPKMRRECRSLYERAAHDFADTPIHFDPKGREARLIGPAARRWLDQHPGPIPAPSR